MTRRRLTTEEKVELYRRQGWCPVRWEHQPDLVKKVIRASGFRPRMKECFYNCQKLIVEAHSLGLRPGRIEYHEGWALSIIPIEHAWLRVDGELVEMTIDDGQTRYLKSRVVPVMDIVENMVRTGRFCPVTRLWELWPEVQAMLTSEE